MSDKRKDGVRYLIDKKWVISSIISVLILLSIIAYFFSPLIDGLVLGLVFAYVARPIKERLDKKHIYLACLVATCCIVIPCMLILGLGTIEAINMLIWIVQHQSEIVDSFIRTLNAMNLPPPVYGAILDFARNYASSFVAVISQVSTLKYAKSLAMVGLNFVISIFVCFFLLVDGERLAEAVMDVLPPEKRRSLKSYLMHSDRVLSGIYIGNFYNAIIVGVISVFVFLFFDIPHIFVLSSFMFLAALLPIIGCWMVIIPAAGFVYWNAGIAMALAFLLTSTIIIYGPSELILKPYIVSITSKTHPLLMLLAFLGGGLVAGVAGLFLAPMMVGLLIAAHRVLIEERDKVYEGAH
ncbi:MAG: AI-2E family transporter [Methanocellales archaeon]|nr:AI-2E family transporter [Methanocellales archaeon]